MAPPLLPQPLACPPQPQSVRKPTDEQQSPSKAGPRFSRRTRAERLCCGVKLTEDPVKWGKHLAAHVEAIVRLHPEADPDTIRLTLMALELTPEERLGRSLRRGRGFATFRIRLDPFVNHPDPCPSV